MYDIEAFNNTNTARSLWTTPPRPWVRKAYHIDDGRSRRTLPTTSGRTVPLPTRKEKHPKMTLLEAEPLCRIPGQRRLPTRPLRKSSSSTRS